MNGNLINIVENKNWLDIADLQAGFYYILIKWKDREDTQHKFIKM